MVKHLKNGTIYSWTLQGRIENSFCQMNEASPKERWNNWKQSTWLWSHASIVTALGELKQKGDESGSA